ncbi:MAG: XRE family transcriptional regulator [Acidobacteria bacterium]|nr:MAG: XRE family transcriptional regulator [Acidobacteriota bacterium]
MVAAVRDRGHGLPVAGQHAADVPAGRLRLSRQAVLGGGAAAFHLGERPQDRLRQELGRHIRLARTERGWTLKELSDESGVSVSQLSSIERGAHLPSLESLVAVAIALGRQPSEWLRAAGF